MMGKLLCFLGFHKWNKVWEHDCVWFCARKGCEHVKIRGLKGSRKNE